MNEQSEQREQKNGGPWPAHHPQDQGKDPLTSRQNQADDRGQGLSNGASRDAGPQGGSSARRDGNPPPQAEGSIGG